MSDFYEKRRDIHGQFGLSAGLGGGNNNELITGDRRKIFKIWKLSKVLKFN